MDPNVQSDAINEVLRSETCKKAYSGDITMLPVVENRRRVTDVTDGRSATAPLNRKMSDNEPIDPSGNCIYRRMFSETAETDKFVKNVSADYSHMWKKPPKTFTSPSRCTNSTKALPSRSDINYIEREKWHDSPAELRTEHDVIFLPPTGCNGLIVPISPLSSSLLSTKLQISEINQDTPKATILEIARHRGTKAIEVDNSVNKNGAPMLEVTKQISSPRITNETFVSEDDEKKAIHMSDNQLTEARKWSCWLRASVGRAERRKAIVAGKTIFNMEPKKGIEYLMKEGTISRQPKAIANFLKSEDLSRKSVGEYFGRLSDKLAANVAREFVSSLDFKNLEVDEALRQMIFWIHPDGESQKLENLFRIFMESYCRQNSNKVRENFKDPETIYILVYSIFMLHTSWYNPSARRLTRPMNCEEFINNLRGVDAGSNMQRDYLSNIYERIIRSEFKSMPDIAECLRSIDQQITGSGKVDSLFQPYRRFIARTAAYEVLNVVARQTMTIRPTARLRGLFIFNDILVVTKPIGGSHSNAATELLGDNKMDSIPALPKRHRRIGSLDRIIGRRSYSPSTLSYSGSEASQITSNSEKSQNKRQKFLPGCFSSRIPINSNFEFRRIIPLVNLQVLVFESEAYSNGIQLRDDENILACWNLPNEIVRQKFIDCLHESMEEMKELLKFRLFSERWPWTSQVKLEACRL